MMLARLKNILLTTATLAVLIVSCTGGGRQPVLNFVDGFRLIILSQNETISGSSRRIGYVTNFSAGTVAVIEDVEGRRVFDTDEFDNEETPLTIGGTPTEIFEWRPDNLAENTLYKLIVIDQENKRLFIYDAVTTTATGETSITHQLVDLGGPEITVASRPLFVDQGRSSNPVLVEVNTNDNTTNENWRVESRGNGTWTVENTTGNQTNRVTADQLYTSDNGEISFTIFEEDVDRRATSGDTFFFGTIKANPLPLPGRPEAAFLDEEQDRLFIGNSENQQIDILDLQTLQFGTAIPLNDGSGMSVIPSDMQKSGDHLVISNSGEGNSIFTLDLQNLTIASFNVGTKTRRLLTRTDSDEVFLLPVNDLSVPIFNLTSGSISAPAITVNATTLAAATFDTIDGVDGNALFVDTDSLANLVDLDERVRKDTRDNGETESFAGNILFVDSGNDSNPSIADIITVDGITRTESWVLTFEGVIEGTVGTEGAALAATFVDANKDFTQLNVQVGDLLVLFPNNPAVTETLAITEIVDATTLNLTNQPNNQVSDIPYEIRAPESYTISGSLSGFQENRLVEGSSGASDSQEITLSISLPSDATDRDDFFSFDTSDGITPIGLNGEFPVDMKIFDERAYILNQNSNNISIVDIRALRLQNEID